MLWRAVCMSGFIVLGVGCSARQNPAIVEPALPQPTVPPASPPNLQRTFERSVLGQSVQGRDIEMWLLRGGSTSVLVMGGIHGNEQTSVDVADGLLQLLKKQPELAQGRTIAILPNTNPDGYATGMRHNANMVDVNRNFAATNFKPSMRAAFRSGQSPESEPETRAVVRAIEIIQPNLLISIHSISKGRECNNYDGPAEDIANIMSRYNGYPAVASIGYPTPGSLGSYAGIDKQIPMITLELPRTLPGNQAWEQNREALLAAIAAAR